MYRNKKVGEKKRKATAELWQTEKGIDEQPQCNLHSDRENNNDDGNNHPNKKVVYRVGYRTHEQPRTNRNFGFRRIQN